MELASGGTTPYRVILHPFDSLKTNSELLVMGAKTFISENRYCLIRTFGESSLFISMQGNITNLML